MKTTNAIKTSEAIVVIDSDPACLGEAADLNDVEAFRDHLAAELSEECGARVSVRLEAGAKARCRSATSTDLEEKAEAALRRILETHEWMNFLGAKAIKTETLYIAGSYRRGCPDNGAGRRVGYGLTAEGAIADCKPWANQAAWFLPRARSIAVVNGFDAKCGKEVFDALRAAEVLPGGEEIALALREGRWADAVAEARARRWMR